MKVQLSFQLGRGCIGTKVKASPVFLLHGKGYARALWYIFLFSLAIPTVTLDISPPIKQVFL